MYSSSIVHIHDVSAAESYRPARREISGIPGLAQEAGREAAPPDAAVLGKPGKLALPRHHVNTLLYIIHHSTAYIYSTAQHYITSQHITAQHITAQHITPHHRISQHSTIHHITSHHTTPPHITAQHTTSQHITAQHITAQHITPHHRISQHSTIHHITL
jgi:hypothetical protein